MADNEFHSGIDYVLSLLKNKQQLALAFWLGFRPLTFDELRRLVPQLSDGQLQEELAKLQNLCIVNPVKDTANCYSLTDEGNTFRQLMMQLSIWGKQQLNDGEEKLSVLTVEPESNAKLDELVKYSHLLHDYL